MHPAAQLLVDLAKLDDRLRHLLLDLLAPLLDGEALWEARNSSASIGRPWTSRICTIPVIAVSAAKPRSCANSLTRSSSTSSLPGGLGGRRPAPSCA